MSLFVFVGTAGDMPGRSKSVALDDIVHAYRWILGREPESAEIAQKLADSARDRDALRARLLASREFRRDYHDRTLSAAPPAEWLAQHEMRLVFLHIPKCGGTTLHGLLAEAVGPGRVGPERHNRLSAQPLGELAAARLLSGHYDRRSIALLPWPNLKIVTLLREPRARLISLYRYLRAHGDRLIERDGLDLARAAKDLAFGPFLRAAETINPASVDNTYLRAFGGWLPFRRWEQRAEPAAVLPLERLGWPLDELKQRAIGFLDGCAAVGVLEAFDESLEAIFTAFGETAPKAYEVGQRLDDLIVRHPAFSPVDALVPTAEEETLIARLTRFDRELYAHGVALLSRRRESATESASRPAPTGGSERAAA